jgi:hypothetical protein
VDWFEMRVGFHGDPKCLGLRARLGNPCAEVYVSRVYAYCYQQEQDRFEGDGAVGILERAAEWKGRTGRLVTALLAEGFLDRDGGALVVHGVSQRLEAAMKRRADGLARWHRHQSQRATNALATEKQRVTDARPNQPTNQEDSSTAGASPAAGRKPKAAKQTDPRFAPLKAAWLEEYGRVYAAGKYNWSAADSVGLHRVIATPVDEFRVRARRGLTASGWVNSATVAKLTSNEVWNRLAAAFAANDASRAIAGAAKWDEATEEEKKWQTP